MKNVTDMFNAMGALANAHPTAIKYIGVASAAIAAAAVAMGTIAIGSLLGIPAGVAGIGALVVALSGLMVIEWDKIRPGLLAFSTALDNFISWLGTIAEKIKGLFTGFGKSAPEQVYPGGASRHPTSFNPGTGGPMKPTPVSLSLNIDGKTLAQAVSDRSPTSTASRPARPQQWTRPLERRRSPVCRYLIGAEDGDGPELQTPRL